MVSKDDFDKIEGWVSNPPEKSKQVGVDMTALTLTQIGKVLCDIRDELERFNDNYKMVHDVQIKNYRYKDKSESEITDCTNPTKRFDKVEEDDYCG